MYVTQDFIFNKSIKSKFVLFWFRLCQLILNIKFKPIRYIFLPLVGAYRIIVDWFIGIDLPPLLNIGPGIKLYHGQGLVIAKGAVIGENCFLRQGVTIGKKISKDGVSSGDPIIGNNVEFGANSCVIGDVVIGDNCIIGAGVVVTKSLKDDSVIVCSSPRVLSGGYL